MIKDSTNNISILYIKIKIILYNNKNIITYIIFEKPTVGLWNCNQGHIQGKSTAEVYCLALTETWTNNNVIRQVFLILIS